MAASKFVSLSRNLERYINSFKAYASLSERSKQWSTFTEDVIDHKFVAQRPFALKKNEELRALGIGSGSGELECEMLTKLLQGYPLINNRVVEPSKDQIIKYKAFAQSKAHELQGVKFDWRQQTLDQYRATDGDGTKFHLISAVHSMYYVGDVDSSLMYLYDLLEHGGKLIVTIVSDNSGFVRMRNRFSRYQDDPTHFIHSADIRRTFDRRNILYSQHHRQEPLKITKCLDETSKDGSLLLDFIVHVAKFKERATDAQYKEVMEYMLSSECSMKDGDEVLLNNDWDALIVNKSE